MRLFGKLLVAVALATIWLLPSTIASAGEVTEGCSARVDGQDVRPSTRQNPIEVEEDATVTVMGRSPEAVTEWKVKMSAGLFKATVASGTADGNDWSGSVDVADYSRFGAGLYEVTGSSEGAYPCEGVAWIKIDKNPLTTVAGIVGVSLSVLGLAGLLFSLKSKVVPL